MIRSAFERDIRSRIEDERGPTLPDDTKVWVPIGVLRGILADLDMWRGIGQRELELQYLEGKSCSAVRCPQRDRKRRGPQTRALLDLLEPPQTTAAPEGAAAANPGKAPGRGS